MGAMELPQILLSGDADLLSLGLERPVFFSLDVEAVGGEGSTRWQQALVVLKKSCQYSSALARIATET